MNEKNRNPVGLEQSMKQRVHLVSGETFTGLCEIDHPSDSLSISTNNGIHTVPFWTIKRFVHSRT